MRRHPSTATPVGRVRGSWAVRTLVAAWLVVHAVFMVGLPVMDGMLGHAGVVAHWEDQSDRDCPPRHDAESCGICHVVSHAAAEPGRVPVAVAIVRRTVVATAPASASRPIDPAALPGSGPRGPPLG